MFRTAVSALALIATLAACTPNPTTEALNKPSPAEKAAAVSAQLNAWFDAKYEEQLQQSPIQMTFLGRKDKNDQVDCFTFACADEQLALQKAAVDELKAKFDYETLSPADKDSYDLWVYQYERAAATVACGPCVCACTTRARTAACASGLRRWGECRIASAVTRPG